MYDIYEVYVMLHKVAFRYVLNAMCYRHPLVYKYRQYCSYLSVKQALETDPSPSIPVLIQVCCNTTHWLKELWNFRSHVLYHRWNFRSLVLSLPGTFVPDSESDMELSLPVTICIGLSVPGTIAPYQYSRNV